MGPGGAFRYCILLTTEQRHHVLDLSPPCPTPLITKPRVEQGGNFTYCNSLASQQRRMQGRWACWPVPVHPHPSCLPATAMLTCMQANVSGVQQLYRLARHIELERKESKGRRKQARQQARAFKVGGVRVYAPGTATGSCLSRWVAGHRDVAHVCGWRVGGHGCSMRANSCGCSMRLFPG